MTVDSAPEPACPQAAPPMEAYAARGSEVGRDRYRRRWPGGTRPELSPDGVGLCPRGARAGSHSRELALAAVGFAAFDRAELVIGPARLRLSRRRSRWLHGQG